MNDVLNSQGYTQAAGWNRIPFSAWLLVMVIAAFSTVLVGIGTRRGIIRVVPQNLQSLALSLQTP